MHPCRYMVHLLLLVKVVIPGGNTAKCYNCTQCAEPFVTSEHNAVECGDGEYCYKMVASLQWHLIESKKSDKSCAPRDMKPGCYENEKSGLKSETCYCDNDLCNHGETQSAHNFMTIVAMATGAALSTATY